MSNEIKIRPSKDFREIIDWVRANCLLNGVKCPSITELTQAIARRIDKEELFRNEYNKK